MVRPLKTQLLFALAACSAAAGTPNFDLENTSGGVFSPDGAKLAFERHVGWARHLGVVELATGKIVWVERGEGVSGMASWGADGSLAYVSGTVTNTALEAWLKRGRDGYGIKIWKDGASRPFLSGRRRDSTPSFSPDMKTVYWSSNEGGEDHRLGRDFLWSAPVGDPGARRRILLNQLKHIDAAAVQPQGSPDGRFLVWANLDCIQDRWSIRCSRVGSPDENFPLTAPDMIAYEPRWSADGRYVVFTGFREGDESWSCYVQEVATGAQRRICTGTEPCLSPDGRTLVYTDAKAKRILFREMCVRDYPFGTKGRNYAVSPADPTLRGEEVVFTTDRECDLPPETAWADADDVYFIRAEVDWSGDRAKWFHRVLFAQYGDASHQGVNFFFFMQAPTFALCDADDSSLLERDMPEQTKMQIEAPAGVPKGTYVLTGIRSRDMVYLSVNGSVATGRIPRWKHADLSHPRRLLFAPSLGGAAQVKKVEFGRGWPRNVPKPPRRADFWPREAAPKRAAAAGKPSFEKIALIDSFDYGKIWDVEKPETAARIVDYAVDEVGATGLMWRSQGGGVPRYVSACENSPRRVAPFEKRIQYGGDAVYGWIDEAKADSIPRAMKAIDARGAVPGIHVTWEENHHQSVTCSQWNLEHPEFSCRTRDGMARPGYTSSLGYDEVLEHKLERLEEILKFGPRALYLDLWRQGGWCAAQEYTPKMRREWRALHGREPPEDAADDRWLGLVSKYVHRYLRAIRKRLDAETRHVDFVLAIPYLDLKDRAVWERYALDWKALAAEGVFDAVSVMSVVPEKGREFESTAEIYRYVVAHRGRAKKVYFPLAAYNFTYGLSSYASATDLPRIECVKRLLALARDCGGAGVTLECVDFDNYRDDEREAIRTF